MNLLEKIIFIKIIFYDIIHYHGDWGLAPIPDNFKHL